MFTGPALLHLYIRDPLNPGNVLGLNSFKFEEIRKFFQSIHLQIIQQKGLEFLEKLKSQLDIIEEHRLRILAYIKGQK